MFCLQTASLCRIRLDHQPGRPPGMQPWRWRVWVSATASLCRVGAQEGGRPAGQERVPRRAADALLDVGAVEDHALLCDCGSDGSLQQTGDAREQQNGKQRATGGHTQHTHSTHTQSTRTADKIQAHAERHTHSREQQAYRQHTSTIDIGLDSRASMFGVTSPLRLLV